MKFNPHRRDGSPSYYTIGGKLLIHNSEMPSPRMSRKQSAPTAVPAPPPPPPPPPVRPPPPAPAPARHGSPSAARKDTVRPPAPVLQGSPSAVRKDPVSVPGAVPSVGPRRSPVRSPSPARAAVDGMQRSGSQEELNAAFERLAMGAVAQQQQQPQPQQQQQTPPPARRMVALSRSRSLDKPPGMQRHIVNGDASQSAGDSQGVTSPLPPPSPKSLSRSPSLRRKELQQSMHESVTSFIEAETSQLLKEIDSALGNKYDLGKTPSPPQHPALSACCPSRALRKRDR
ncbi:protein transport protein sec31-like isoform X2 [Amphibalanus amphitrite]|uniref:protein transport protein sec31-like isoform X2 n=1 Tax=Amphibalanus amphitrite TaxID=1232801 RepID=UPI001C90D0E9|nr:protein transport protein sec31-like isoform X2 [Amphibalanus amphitrite]